MKDALAIALILCVLFCVRWYTEAQVRIAIIDNCAKLAGNGLSMQITNEGCKIADWKVKP